MKSCFLTLLFLSAFFVQPAHASDKKLDPVLKDQTAKDFGKTTALFRPQNILNIGKQSGQETIMLSFYRNANAKPDFKKWSFMTERAVAAPEYDRAVVALNEQVRMQTVYTNLDPAGLLNIQAPIDVSRYSSSQEKLFIPTFANRAGKEGGALGQKVYGEDLAIVIPDLAQFAAIKMTNADAKYLYETIKSTGRDMSDLEDAVIGELLVKPQHALYRKSNRVGSNNQSVFFVQLAQLTFWVRGKKEGEFIPVWSWRADWYKPEDNNPALLQLYKALN